LDSIYSYPHYYEIAFSYRDIPAEVDTMEEAIAKYSKIPVKTVLELACGNSPHMLELISRGYEYWGLDLNPTMIEYAREKAAREGHDPKFVLADLKDFKLDEPADFLYIMMGSLYVQSTEDLLSHFTAAEAGLKPGGLYFLDWCIDFEPLSGTRDSWVQRRQGITVTTRYTTRVHNAAEQLYEENILFTIQDKGQQRTLLHRGLRRAIFPQEFVLAATKLHRFELLGWWNDWNLQEPLGEGRGEIVRPITVLRRL
jgi:SAM-dependent methyltransferase